MSLYSNNVSNNPLGLDGLITGQFDAVYINGVAVTNGVPYTGAISDVDLNAKSLTNVNSLVVGGKYYDIVSFVVDVLNPTIATVTIGSNTSPFKLGDVVTIDGCINSTTSTTFINSNQYVVNLNNLTSFIVSNPNNVPAGTYTPAFSYIFLTSTGMILSNSINVVGSITTSSLDSQVFTSASLSSTNATIGKAYTLDAFLAFIDAPMQVTIHLIGDLVPFNIGDIVTLTGSDTPLMNNTGYLVIDIFATTFIVTNIGNVPNGNYFPVGAFMYLTNTGLLTTNDLSIVGTMTSSNIDAINVLTAKVTSPVYTTQTNTDLTILGKNSKNINMSINGTNILQITGTAIIPYQPITGYLTSALASSTYAPLTNPSFNGTISSSGVYVSTSGTFWPPTVGTGIGQGDRLVLKQATGPTTYSYTIGLYTDKMWYSVPLNSSHVFYINNNITINSSLANTYIYGSSNNVLNVGARGATGGAWIHFINSMNTVYGLIGFDNNYGNVVFPSGNTGIANAMVIGTTTTNPIVFGTNNASRMILNSAGQLAIGNLSPQTTLDINGVCNVYTGSRFAYSQSPLVGSIILGSTSSSYGGGGTTTTAWQTGMMMETNANQEISVHHSGDSVRSLLFYQGSKHKIYLGRDCGWGTTVVQCETDIYTQGWFRPTAGNQGMYWDALGFGVKGTLDSTYGNITTHGSGRNAWRGYDIDNSFTFMGDGGDSGGIHNNSPNVGWMIYWTGNSTNKSVNIVKKCSIGTTDTPSYMCHIRGNHCVQSGDDSKTIYGPNSSWGCYLCIGGGTNRCTNSIAQMITTNGNLHIDCSTDSGRSIYLNYYAYNGGIGPANQNTQIWGPVYMNGLVNQNSNYSQIVSGINGAALMYSQFWSTISANQSAWASGWSSANFNKTSSKSTLRFEGYCSYYVSASSMNYINVRIYNSYTNQYSYYNTNLFTNVTYNHAPCPISFCIKDIDAGFCNVYWYMSGSNWVSDSNDYITVTTIIQPD